MDKFIIVVVECFVKYLIYGKFIKCFIKFYVYDENNVCNKGDVVIVCECCLLFKSKFWMLVDVVEKVGV